MVAVDTSRINEHFLGILEFGPCTPATSPAFRPLMVSLRLITQALTMSVAILGDLSLSKMVKTESFKAQLAVDYASYQVSRQRFF